VTRKRPRVPGGYNFLPQEEEKGDREGLQRERKEGKGLSAFSEWVEALNHSLTRDNVNRHRKMERKIRRRHLIHIWKKTRKGEPLRTSIV